MEPLLQEGLIKSLAATQMFYSQASLAAYDEVNIILLLLVGLVLFLQPFGNIFFFFSFAAYL